MFSIKTLIIFCGMYYATPQWCEKQLPHHIKEKYTIHYLKYGTSINQVTQPIDYKSTGIIGFSAGGLDVLKYYNQDWAFVGLIDPTCRDKYKTLNFTKNTYMIYNDKNWGGTNKSLKTIANRVNQCGGNVKKIDLDHQSHFKYFFETYFKR
jgi:hypothetical protein